MTRCKNNDDCLLYGSRAAVLLLFVVCRNVMEAHSEFREEIKKERKKEIRFDDDDGYDVTS